MKPDNPQQDDRFKEQEAPLKNTDHAFVQVGKDGAPVIPESTDHQQKEQPFANENNAPHS